MTSIRKLALACVASAMVALPLNAAAQGPVNQDTFFTFSQAVELPNKTLPAGTYFFQLADSPANRHIVKVMSQDRKELHATLLAIPFYSNDRPSDEPQVRFMETPATASNGTSAGSNAIKIWFYPGNSVGHEFIYPRAQAMRIAARTGQSVLTTKAEGDVTAESELARVDRNGVVAEASSPENPNVSQSSTAVTSTAQDTTSTPQAPAAETTVATDTRSTPAPEQAPRRETVGAITGGDTQADRPAAPARTDLPNTAGMLPLLALIGIGAIAGSQLLRRAR